MAVRPLVVALLAAFGLILSSNSMARCGVVGAGHSEGARPAGVLGDGARIDGAQADGARVSAESPQDTVPPEDVDALPAAFVAQRLALVPRLCELARWCQQVELFAERDRVWRAVLTVDPENAEARRGLKHTRAADGTWRTGPERDVANRTERALPEFHRRRGEILRPFSECAIAHALSAGPRLRARLIDAVYALDPDDPTVHVWLGEVKDGARWVLPETVRARGRRAELRGFVASARDARRAVEPLTATPADLAPESGWAVGFLADAIRVFTDGDAEEARTIAATCAAVLDVGARLFGASAGGISPFALYRVNPGRDEAFLERIDALTPADRTRLAALESSALPRRVDPSTQAPRDDVGLWCKSKAQALDTSVRHTWSRVLARGLGIDTRCGWAFEGVGLYLTREVTGTRLTWFVSPHEDTLDPARAALGGRLLAPEANWMNEALRLLTSPAAPSITEVMSRDLAGLDARHVLVGYVLAAYLLEGRPDSATEFLRRSAAGERPEVVTGAVVSMTPEELQARLVRWLSERR